VAARELADSAQDEQAAAPPAATGTAARGRVLALRLGRRLGNWAEGDGAFDTAVCLIYAGFAFYLTHGLWPNPATRAIADNVNDQALNEWFLSHGVLFWRGDFSLVTSRLNAPDGVNLMSNASNIFYSIVMAPVTVLFGAAVTFTVLMGLNLAATAAGWYLVLARGLRLNRAGALVGGAFAGFAPGMISQSNSHIHMTAQWLAPLIVYCVVRLTRVTTYRATVLTAIGLAVSVSAQLLVGEEVLFLIALTLAIFSATYALRRRRWAGQVARRFLAGLAVAAGATLILLAYPLWVQFQGPQHTPNAPFEPKYFYSDLASFVLFSPLSIAGGPEAGRLATSSAEYNTYLGLPLVILVFGLLIWRWRSPAVFAIGVTGLIMAVLSLGPTVTVNGTPTSIPSPYRLLNGLPVINSALPTRYALVLIPLIGVLLAYSIDAAARAGGFARIAVPVAAAAALLPTLPLPIATTSRAPVPAFISSGAWQQCTPDGGVMVLVPAPTPGSPDLMRWPATANAAFRIPEGFFIGPYAAGGRSSLGIYPRPTSQLLNQVAETGKVPAIDDGARAQAHADLTYWNANCVALAHVRNEAALRSTIEQLLGPGTPVKDTWTWKVSR
jgi:hypothetical protein